MFKFEDLIGKTIIAVAHDPKAEGTYYLILNDGPTVSFTSTGDDATHTIFEVV